MHQILASEPRFTLDYAELIDSDTFEIATESTRAPHAIVAGWIDGVRLIDNMQVQTTEAGAAE